MRGLTDLTYFLLDDSYQNDKNKMLRFQRRVLDNSNRSSDVALDGDKSPSPLVAKGLRAGVNWRQKKKKKTAFPREETLDGDEKKMVRARSNLISRKGGTFRLFGLIP